MPSLRLLAYFLGQSLPPPVCPSPPEWPPSELAALQAQLGAVGYRIGKAELAVHNLSASLKEQALPTCGVEEEPPKEAAQAGVAAGEACPEPPTTGGDSGLLAPALAGAGLLEIVIGLVLCRRHGACGRRVDTVSREVAGASPGGRDRRRGAGVLR